MSKKHNTKHLRSRSNYKARLEARGLTASPRQADFRLDDGKMSSQGR